MNVLSHLQGWRVVATPLTDEQKAELDRRLDAYAADGNAGRPAGEAIADIRKRL